MAMSIKQLDLPYISKIYFSESELLFAVITSSEIIIFETASMKEKSRISRIPINKPIRNDIRQLKFTNDDSKIIYSDSTAKIYVHSTISGILLHDFLPMLAKNNLFVISPNSKYLAVANVYGFAYCDITTGKIIKCLLNSELQLLNYEIIINMNFHVHDTYIFFVTNRGTIFCYNILLKKVVHIIILCGMLIVEKCIFSPDECKLVAIINNNIHVWDLYTGKLETKIIINTNENILIDNFQFINDSVFYYQKITNKIKEIVFFDIDDKTSKTISMGKDDLFSISEFENIIVYDKTKRHLKKYLIRNWKKIDYLNINHVPQLKEIYGMKSSQKVLLIEDLLFNDRYPF